MKKLWQITLLTTLLAWSLQCYEYKFINRTDEQYDIQVELSCGGDPLKGRLEPYKTLKLASTGSKAGCCYKKVKIHPLKKPGSMVIDFNHMGRIFEKRWAPSLGTVAAAEFCSNKKWTISKTSSGNYFIGGLYMGAQYGWE